MAGTPAGGALTDLRAKTVNQIKLLLEALWMTFATAFNPLLTEHQQRTEINLYTATIAGLVLHAAQQIPSPGQVFVFFGFRFEILERQRNQLTRLKVTPPAEPSVTNPASAGDRPRGHAA